MVHYSTNLVMQQYCKTWKFFLFVCLLFNGTFSTNRLYHAIEVWCISCRAGGTTQISCS